MDASLRDLMVGQLLAVVGIDANNGMYPFAWAVLERETKSSWTCFLGLLNKNISPYTNVSWTIIQTNKKG